MNFDKQSSNENIQPEYKLGFSENGAQEELDLFHPSEMKFEDFQSKYLNVMESVKLKEKIGKLDPHDKSYIAMSEDDWKLMAKDWKEFSRSRGFSEENIKEYEKWLILSGQKDKLLGAINDPWRRGNPVNIKNLYLAHLENAIKKGYVIPEDVMSDYNELKKEEESVNIIKSHKNKSTEEGLPIDNEDDDWE